MFIDGLVGDQAIVEIKCPYTAKDSENSIDAVNNKLVSCVLTIICIYLIFICIIRMNLFYLVVILLYNTRKYTQVKK